MPKLINSKIGYSSWSHRHWSNFNSAPYSTGARVCHPDRYCLCIKYPEVLHTNTTAMCTPCARCMLIKRGANCDDTSDFMNEQHAWIALCITCKFI